MLLENVGKYNDFTPEFREALEDKVRGFGKVLRYKFNIGNPNPHPDLKGQTVWPSRWTLDPCTFTVLDKKESRTGKQKLKYVGIVKMVDEEKNTPSAFEKIRVLEADGGILTLHIDDDPLDLAIAMMLELHPKLKGGEFADSNKAQIVERIDSEKLSKDKRTERNERMKAYEKAKSMSDAEVQQFADAQSWTLEDIEILRDKIEGLAENSPEFFNKLTDEKTVEAQALVRRSIDNQVIAYNPSENKFIYLETGETLAVLSNSGKGEVETLAEFLLMGGKDGKKAFDQLKKLVK